MGRRKEEGGSRRETQRERGIGDEQRKYRPLETRRKRRKEKRRKRWSWGRTRGEGEREEGSHKRRSRIMKVKD